LNIPLLFFLANRLRTEVVVFQKERDSAIERMLHKGLALVLKYGWCARFLKTYDKPEATTDTQVSQIVMSACIYVC
jgi:hypothetical protein